MSLSRKHERLPLPERPYRSSAIVHGAFALVVVVVAVVTGGGLLTAIGVALAYFVLATGYAWWQFRRRLAEAARANPGEEAR